MEKDEKKVANTLPPVPKDKEDVEDEETSCGIGSFRPRWLQSLANPKVFFLNYCILGVLQGAQFTYLVGCLSTLEKRYSYESKITGLIMISDEFCPILFGTLIGYFGNKTHRPRLVAFGMMVNVLSAFISAIPYFMYGRAEHLESPIQAGFKNTTALQLCDYNEKSELCDNSPTIPAVSFLFFGNFLKGFGSLAFYSIGTTYLDDSVQKKNTPAYFGTLYALRLLGPVMGFLLTSFTLKYYEDPLYDPGYPQEDPRWVGAWWLGFVILGTAIFVFSLPIVLFPKTLPSKKLQIEKEKQKKEEKKKQEKAIVSPLESLKDLKEGIRRLVSNPILICHSLGGVLRINGIAGYFVLSPRYMEATFRQSASNASLYSGPAAIVSMQVGTLLGGLVIKKLRPSPRGLTGGIVLVELFSILGFLICMFLYCPSIEMQGVSLQNSMLDLENDCNAPCLCTTKTYTPICGPDGRTTYFSPCFAGCSDFDKFDNGTVFTNCTCVHDSSGMFVHNTAKKGYCPSDCGWMIPFVVVLGLGKLISSTARVGNTIVMLRCVDPADKSMALGTMHGIFSLLAFIPYPLIYGALADATCLVWEESCGRRGNCWLYDTDKLRYYLHGVSAAFVLIGSITDILVWYFSPRMKNLYDDNDDGEIITMGVVKALPTIADEKEKEANQSKQ